MANEEVNKSYKEYSINFLIDKIDTEKKKLAILYQDLYKLKEDQQRYLQILTNEKNMMQAIFISTPAINQCDQLERKRELTEKLHEIIKAEREGKQKESEKESQIRLSMAKLDGLRGSFSRKTNVVLESHFDVDGNQGYMSFLGANSHQFYM